MTDQQYFMAAACKAQTMAAGELADKLKSVIYECSGKVPLALAIGVLRIVETEVLAENANNTEGA